MRERNGECRLAVLPWCGCHHCAHCRIVKANFRAMHTFRMIHRLPRVYWAVVPPGDARSIANRIRRHDPVLAPPEGQGSGDGNLPPCCPVGNRSIWIQPEQGGPHFVVAAVRFTGSTWGYPCRVIERVNRQLLAVVPSNQFDERGHRRRRHPFHGTGTWRVPIVLTRRWEREFFIPSRNRDIVTLVADAVGLDVRRRSAPSGDLEAAFYLTPGDDWDGAEGVARAILYQSVLEAYNPSGGERYRHEHRGLIRSVVDSLLPGLVAGVEDGADPDALLEPTRSEIRRREPPLPSPPPGTAPVASATNWSGFDEPRDSGTVGTIYLPHA